MTVETIVVGIDGSEGSLVAATWAADLATVAGAAITAVHALTLLEALDGGLPVPAEPLRDEIRARFEDIWCAPIDRAAVSARKLFRDGSPVPVLLAVAKEEGADLIVVGSRGLGDDPVVLLGSTSSQVAQRARCPVVIVPDAR